MADPAAGRHQRSGEYHGPGSLGEPARARHARSRPRWLV
jgi:hypothetical protein